MQSEDNDYITDGLILHLDAINNTPEGHRNDSPIWYDLSSSGYNASLTNCVWHNDYIIFETDTDIGYGDFGSNINFGNITTPTTIEIVGEYHSGKWISSSYQKFLSNTNAVLRNAEGANVWNSLSTTAGHIYYQGSYGAGIRFRNITGYDLNPRYYHHTISTHLNYAANSYKRAYRNGGGGEDSSISRYEAEGNLLSSWNVSFNYRYVTAPAKFYALRLYNRLLTVEEIKHNARLDKMRYNI